MRRRRSRACSPRSVAAGGASLLLALVLTIFAAAGDGDAAGTLPPPPCDEAELNLIFQREALDGDRHQSDTPFAGAVTAVGAAVPEGEVGTLRVHAAIVSRLSGRAGVSGWAIQTRVSGDLRIASATAAGTAAAVAPEGFVADGFTRVVMPNLRGEPGFYAAAVLSFSSPRTLAPVGTATVVALDLESSRPQPREALRGFVEWVDGCAGCDRPFIMSATVGGRTRRFCSRPVLEVELVPESFPASFVRCDPNGDGELTLTDAAFIANELFLGAEPAACRDTEDCNGDLVINLTDVIFALAYLFDGGSPPPAPFPGCGRAAATIGEDSCPRGSTSCP